MSEELKEILYNIFCGVLVCILFYFAYKYIYLDYLTWGPVTGAK